MTSQTAQRAPTEAEIRAAVTQSVGDGYVGLDYRTSMLRVVLDSDMARTRMLWDPEFYPPDDHPGTLWADLRPDERDDLEAAMVAVLNEVEYEATAMLIERATVAAVTFAELHPDTPRGHWPLNGTGPAAA